MRGVTSSRWILLSNQTKFQLTRLMRGVTFESQNIKNICYISTHTPHARRDVFSSENHVKKFNFNSHASCEAWRIYLDPTDENENFNSHASCEAWLFLILSLTVSGDFNSHASCEAWLVDTSAAVLCVVFQLTRLMRGVTKTGEMPLGMDVISTHTPHARRDVNHADVERWRNISTHTPHARRDRQQYKNIGYYEEFQLTRLMRGVTPRAISRQRAKQISTHTPHARRDPAHYFAANAA